MNPLLAIGVYSAHRLVYWTSHSYLDQSELYPLLEKISRKLHKKKDCEGVYFRGFNIKVGRAGEFNYALISSEESEKFNSMITRQLTSLLETQPEGITIGCIAALDKLIKSDNLVLEQKTVFINDQVEPNRLFDAADLQKLDTVLGRAEPSLELELLSKLFHKIVFETLKDDKELIEVKNEERPKTATSSRTIDNVSIVSSNGKALSTVSIRPSANKEKAIKVQIGSSQIKDQNEISTFNPFSKPVPKILLKEKMEIVVKGIQILSKSVGGSILIDNLVKGVEYYFEMENDYWFNRDVINHTINDYLSNAIKIIQEPDGVLFSASNQYGSNSLTLYEYKINSKLIDIDTVPFMLAYRSQPGQLALKISLNPSHRSNFINFQLKIEFSEYLDPQEIVSSHMGTVIGKYYLIIFEQEELEPNSVVVKLSTKNKSTRCVGVKAMCSLSASFASLQPNLTNLSMKNIQCDKVTVLDVDYLLIIN